MKKIILICIMGLMNFIYCAPVEQNQQGYAQAKGVIGMIDPIQSIFNEYALILNLALNEINDECSNVGTDIECAIQKDITVTITDTIAQIDPEGDLRSGYKLTFPVGSLTFTKISEGEYDFSIRVKENLVLVNSESFSDNPRDETVEIFSWKTDGSKKSIVIKGKDENGADINFQFVLTKNSTNNLLVGKGSYDNSNTNTNDKFALNFDIKMEQYSANNGVIVDVIETAKSLIDASHNSYYTINIKADNQGGYLKTKSILAGLGSYEEEFVFDGSGRTKMYKYKTDTSDWITDSNDATFDYTPYYIGDDNSTISNTDTNITTPIESTQQTLSLVVIQKDEPAKEENILGYGSFFDANTNGKIDQNEVDIYYFGDADLLMECSIDIYSVNGDSYTKIDGICLSLK